LMFCDNMSSVLCLILLTLSSSLYCLLCYYVTDTNQSFPTRLSSDLTCRVVRCVTCSVPERKSCPPWCARKRPHRIATRSWSFTRDRKSTRLNSSHGSISYAVFCLNTKKNSLNYEFRDVSSIEINGYN